MKKLYGVMSVLLVCAIVGFPSQVQAANVNVEIDDLNDGILGFYNAGDTLLIFGDEQLNSTGWATLRGASRAFSLVFENGQTSVPHEAMSENTALISISGEQVTSVGERAFWSCVSLESVNFPALVSVGESAFHFCSELRSVSLSRVTSVGRNAFRYCGKLESVSMPIVESIPEGAFADCVELAELYVPRAGTIGRHAFENNSSLATISLPATTGLETRAFYRASSLKEVSLPTVRDIGNEAFAGCESLSVLRLGDADPSVHESAFTGVGRITIYTDRSSLTSRNYPPHDLATSADSEGGGCNAVANAGLYILLCASLFLKRKRNH